MKIIITESQKQMLIESVDSFVVKEVPNKGKGVIVQTNFKKGDEIGKLISKTPNKIGRKIKRTAHETDVLGRYSNHSSNPNTKYDMRDGEVYLIASRDIDKGEELLINYKKLENLLGMRPGLFLTDDIVD
jgi:SET domain-containing protein